MLNQYFIHEKQTGKVLDQVDEGLYYCVCYGNLTDMTPDTYHLLTPWEMKDFVFVDTKHELETLFRKEEQ